MVFGSLTYLHKVTVGRIKISRKYVWLQRGIFIVLMGWNFIEFVPKSLNVYLFFIN